MENIKKKYGILGERFQIIHKGHEHLLLHMVKNYSYICLGIVNPNPRVPACSASEHEPFALSRNPFTYFQRAYLLNNLLRYNSVQAVIVPHWHPRKSLELETTFLPSPKRSREWVIPLNQEDKIEDFENLGENVNAFGKEPAEVQWMTYDYKVKLWFNNHNESFKACIPKKLQHKREELLMKKRLGEQFIVVPIIGDNLHPLLICGGIQWSVDIGAMLIFSPVVNVANETEWWKFEPIDNDFFTFYQKHEIINHIMKHLNFYDYMVIPIIVKNKKCQAIDSFLPDSENRSWLFIHEINSDPDVFNQFRYEDSFSVDKETVPTGVYSDVSIYIFNLYKQRNYYNKSFNNKMFL